MENICSHLEGLCHEFNKDVILASKLRDEQHSKNRDDSEIIPKIDLFLIKNYIKNEIPEKFFSQINWDQIQLLIDFGPHATIFTRLSGDVYQLGRLKNGSIIDNYARFKTLRHRPVSELCDDYNTGRKNVEKNKEIGLIRKSIIFLFILDGDVEFIKFFLGKRNGESGKIGKIGLNLFDIHLISPLYLSIVLHHFDLADFLYKNGATIPGMGKPCHIITSGNGFGTYKSVERSETMVNMIGYDKNELENGKREKCEKREKNEKRERKYPQISTMLRYAFTHDIPNFLEWVLTHIETNMDDEFNELMNIKNEIEKIEKIEYFLQNPQKNFEKLSQNFYHKIINLSNFVSKLFFSIPFPKKKLQLDYIGDVSDLFQWSVYYGHLFNIYTIFSFFGIFVNLAHVFSSNYFSILFHSLSETDNIFLLKIILDSIVCPGRDLFSVENKFFLHYLKFGPNRLQLTKFILSYSLNLNSTKILKFLFFQNNENNENNDQNDKDYLELLSDHRVCTSIEDVLDWITPKGLSYILKTSFLQIIFSKKSDFDSCISLFQTQQNSACFLQIYPIFRDFLIREARFNPSPTSPSSNLRLLLPSGNNDNNNPNLHPKNVLYWFDTINSCLNFSKATYACWLLKHLPIELTRLYFSFVYGRSNYNNNSLFISDYSRLLYFNRTLLHIPLFSAVQFFSKIPLLDIYSNCGCDLTLKCNYYTNLGVIYGNQFDHVEYIIENGSFCVRNDDNYGQFPSSQRRQQYNQYNQYNQNSLPPDSIFSPQNTILSLHDNVTNNNTTTYYVKKISGVTALMVAMLYHTGFTTDQEIDGVWNPSEGLRGYYYGQHNNQKITTLDSIDIGNLTTPDYSLKHNRGDRNGEDDAAYIMEKIISCYIAQNFPKITNKIVDENFYHIFTPETKIHKMETKNVEKSLLEQVYIQSGARWACRRMFDCTVWGIKTAFKTGAVVLGYFGQHRDDDDDDADHVVWLG